MDDISLDELINSIVPPQLENLQLPSPELIQYYKDYFKRVIWITEEINANSYSIIQSIIQFNREDDKIEPSLRKPIRFIIASPGGSLEVARSIIAVMRLSQTPIYTIALGCVASAASMIFLAGHKRYAIAGSYWLFHKGSCQNIGGSYDEVQAFMEEYKHQITELLEYYKQYTKFEPQYIEAKLNNASDWYIHIDEAQSNGIIDGVVNDISLIL